MSIGLKNGTVRLMPHQHEWEINAKETIELMKAILDGVSNKGLAPFLTWQGSEKPTCVQQGTPVPAEHKMKPAALEAGGKSCLSYIDIQHAGSTSTIKM